MSEERGRLKIFVHGVSGAVIAAREISRKDGIILVEYPAFVRLRDDKTGFEFEALSYVARTFNLYREACLGDTEMPNMMVPFFEKYAAQRERSE